MQCGRSFTVRYWPADPGSDSGLHEPRAESAQPPRAGNHMWPSRSAKDSGLSLTMA